MKCNSTEEIVMTDSSVSGPILVLGGTGKTGARVVNAKLDGGVQQVLSREPRDFADFAREAAAAGVWNV
jgi:hypothetical protein